MKSLQQIVWLFLLMNTKYYNCQQTAAAVLEQYHPRLVKIKWDIQPSMWVKTVITAYHQGPGGSPSSLLLQQSYDSTRQDILDSGFIITYVNLPAVNVGYRIEAKFAEIAIVGGQITSKETTELLDLGPLPVSNMTASAQKSARDASVLLQWSKPQRTSWWDGFIIYCDITGVTRLEECAEQRLRRNTHDLVNSNNVEYIWTSTLMKGAEYNFYVKTYVHNSSLVSPEENCTYILDPAAVADLKIERDIRQVDSLVVSFQKPIFNIWDSFLIQVDQIGGNSSQTTIEDTSQKDSENCVFDQWKLYYHWSSLCPYFQNKVNYVAPDLFTYLISPAKRGALYNVTVWTLASNRKSDPVYSRFLTSSYPQDVEEVKNGTYLEEEKKIEIELSIPVNATWQGIEVTCTYKYMSPVDPRNCLSQFRSLGEILKKVRKDNNGTNETVNIFEYNHILKGQSYEFKVFTKENDILSPGVQLFGFIHTNPATIDGLSVSRDETRPTSLFLTLKRPVGTIWDGFIMKLKGIDSVDSFDILLNDRPYSNIAIEFHVELKNLTRNENYETEIWTRSGDVLSTIAYKTQLQMYPDDVSTGPAHHNSSAGCDDHQAICLSFRTPNHTFWDGYGLTCNYLVSSGQHACNNVTILPVIAEANSDIILNYTDLTRGHVYRFAVHMIRNNIWSPGKPLPNVVYAYPKSPEVKIVQWDKFQISVEPADIDGIVDSIDLLCTPTSSCSAESLTSPDGKFNVQLLKKYSWDIELQMRATAHGKSDSWGPKTLWTTIPAPVSNLTAIESDNGDYVVLSWEEPTQTGWLSYLVKCTVSSGYCPPEQNLAPNTTSVIFRSQSPGALWSFSVVSVGYAGQTTDNILEVDYTERPTPITELSISRTSDTDAKLTWTSEYITKYGSIWERLILYCNMQGLQDDMTACPPNQDLDGDSFEMGVGGLIPGNQYTYHILSFIDDLSSDPNKTAFQTLSIEPINPTLKPTLEDWKLTLEVTDYTGFFTHLTLECEPTCTYLMINKSLYEVDMVESYDVHYSISYLAWSHNTSAKDSEILRLSTGPELVRNLRVSTHTQRPDVVFLEWEALNPYTKLLFRYSNETTTEKEHVEIITTYPTDSLRFTIPDHLPGCSYTFYVQPFDDSGYRVYQELSANITIDLDPLEILNYTITGNSITITWNKIAGLYDTIHLACEPQCYKNKNHIQIRNKDQRQITLSKLSWQTTYQMEMFTEKRGEKRSKPSNLTINIDGEPCGLPYFHHSRFVGQSIESGFIPSNTRIYLVCDPGYIVNSTYNFYMCSNGILYGSAVCLSNNFLLIVTSSAGGVLFLTLTLSFLTCYLVHIRTKTTVNKAKLEAKASNAHKTLSQISQYQRAMSTSSEIMRKLSEFSRVKSSTVTASYNKLYDFSSASQMGPNSMAEVVRGNQSLKSLHSQTKAKLDFKSATQGKSPLIAHKEEIEHEEDYVYYFAEEKNTKDLADAAV